MREAVVERLNGLILLDRDAVRAYERAIAECERDDVRSTLAELRSDLRWHLRELEARVLSYGGEAPEEPEEPDFFIEGVSEPPIQGDLGALVAARACAELIKRAYQTALVMEPPDDVKAMIGRHYVDSLRHLARIREALNRFLWEVAPAA
jgi:hypothetical protein